MDLRARYEAMKTERRAVFHGRVYRYSTPSDGLRVIGVCRVLGDNYAVCWVRDNGTLKRVKSVSLPVIDNPKDLQDLLDTWAVMRRLKEVSGEHSTASAAVTIRQ